jgi:hypothetical protein
VLLHNKHEIHGGFQVYYRKIFADLALNSKIEQAIKYVRAILVNSSQIYDNPVQSLKFYISGFISYAVVK